MRNLKISALVVITIVFATFTFGFFLGRNQNQSGISVSVPGEFLTMPPEETQSETKPAVQTEAIAFPIAINEADKESFMALPGIGEVLAQRIIDYRTENGSFSSLEELLNVEGVGKKRLEEILDLITLGG